MNIILWYLVQVFSQENFELKGAAYLPVFAVDCFDTFVKTCLTWVMENSERSWKVMEFQKPKSIINKPC